MKTIPIYRARKIDSDKYVEGFLNKAEHIYYDDDKNDETAYYIMKNMTTECEDKSYFDFYGFKEIDPSTLSIHFPDMLASDSDRLLPNGEKDLRVFASLSEDGKGGDIVTGKCRDINKDELIGLHKPLAYKGLVRFYKETSMSVVIETHEEIIASTEHWSQPLIARRGEALRWSDCREDMKIIGIQQ